MCTSAALHGASLRVTPFVEIKRVQGKPVSRTALRVEANKSVQKKLKVILTSNIPKLGSEGEVTSVPLGYWRNYLKPQGLAKFASQTVLDEIRKKQEDELRAKLEVKAQAEAFATALTTIGKFVIRKKVGNKDQIYGSVQVQEVAEAIYQQIGRHVDEKSISIPNIKAIGTYECTVKLHPEVTATFIVAIQKEKNLGFTPGKNQK